ncbi:MAG TPA: 2-oxoacid:ferredoxin oxidoreductase subunit gamma, partial [Myxococcales bacterium]|nr:2-oxoacid:ferredoxin oxidoreductase subunit gamma [Myxococcales bacterium]
MAQTDIVMAGFGGQGLMAIGKMLAKAAMAEGQHVTWMPAYGPEMRGGTANC